MDDIYGDLENYNDTNITEIINENKHLKIKLEEYSSTLVKLQKDFDKLNSEYKKLEVNYSSLLKTAKAEIERKTKMITQLNLEKDMLVINSMQRNQNILRAKPNVMSTIRYGDKKNNYDNISDVSKGNKNRQEILVNPSEFEGDSRRRGVTPEKVSSANSVSTLCTADVMSHHNDKKKEKTHLSEMKESIPKDIHLKCQDPHAGKANTKVASIVVKRRQSKTSEVKFSSDEDVEKLDTKTNSLKKDSNKDNKSRELKETSRYHSSRGETRRSRYQEKHDKYSKDRGRYPDRNRYRSSRDESYKDGRSRQILGSPPPGKYDRSKSRDRRFENRDYRNIDNNPQIPPDKQRRNDKNGESCNKLPDKQRRSDYPVSVSDDHHNNPQMPPDKQRSDYNEDFFNNPQIPPIKQKSDYPEEHYENPKMLLKRRRSDHLEEPYNIPEMLPDKQKRSGYTEETCYYNPQMPPNKRRQDYIEEPYYKKRRTEYYDSSTDQQCNKNKESQLHLEVMMDDTTCQSPDYNHFDNNPQHFIKEIIHTAEVELDDPRITSKKYHLRKMGDKVYLSRVGFIDVDIKPIDWSRWGMEKVVLPEALKNCPNTAPLDDNCVKRMNMTPMSHSSMESGELFGSEDEAYFQVHPKADFLMETPKNFSDNVCKQYDTECSKPSDNSKFQTDNTTDLAVQYKIPKLKIKIDRYCNHKIKLATSENITKIDEPHDTMNKEMLTIMPNVHQQDGNLLSVDKHSSRLEKEIDFNNKEIVAGDLELSEEENSMNYNKNETVDDNQMLHDSKKEKIHKEIEKNDVNEHNKILVTKKKSDSSKEGKKDKQKKKSRNEQNEEAAQNDSTKQVVNQVSECKNIKNKFSDLFGDSSSLITPDELGVRVTEVVPEKFSSVFENTQDAIDLNFEDIRTVQKNYEDGAKRVVLTVDKEKLQQNSTFHKEVLENNQCSTVVTVSGVDNSCVEQPLENLYENINYGDNTDDSNVLKTVIISTGKQPQCESEITVADDDLALKSLPDENEYHQTHFPISMQGIATSTPFKSSSEMTSILSANNDKVVKDGASLCKDNISISNTNVPKNESDAPDITIFVKRRRKIKKQSL